MIADKIPAYCNNGAKITSQQNAVCIRDSVSGIAMFYTSHKGIAVLILAAITATLITVFKNRRRRNA